MKVKGQDEQQPRKERQARVSRTADDASVSDVEQLDVTLDTATDAEEYSDIEIIPLELDNIILTESPDESPNTNVTDWTWNH